MDWTDTKQWKTGNNDQPRMSDQAELLDLSDGKYHTVRFVGKPSIIAQHWLNTLAKEGGKSKKAVNNFPKMCHGLVINKDGKAEIEAEKCAYCTVLEHTPTIEVWINVIDRKIQENEPKKKAKHTRAEREKKKLNGMTAFFMEDIDSESWTPMRAMRITPSVGRKISEIASLNTRKVDGVRKAFNPDHSKYGFDLMIKYDSKANSASEMYSIQKGENTALEENEIAYLRWDLSLENTEKPADAAAEAKRTKKFLCNRAGEPTFPDLLAEGGAKKKKADHSRYEDNFDEDDDTDDDEEPRKKKKKPAPSKSRRRDDDDDDDDADEDDEDEKPRKKKKATVKKSKRSDPDEDEDEDEEERPRKKKKVPAKKASSKSRRKDEDEDDDESPWDDDDDEEDDDD